MESPIRSLLTERDGLVELRVRAAPGSSRARVQGVHGDALKLAVQAPPERGKANKALAALLAKSLGLRPAQVTIRSGETSRDKVFAISGASLETLIDRLAALLGIEKK